MINLRTGIFGLSLLALMMFACGPVENNGGVPWGGFCNRTADCAPGLVCKGNICSIDTTDGDEDSTADRIDPDDTTITDGDSDTATEDIPDNPNREIFLKVRVYTNPVNHHIPVTCRYRYDDTGESGRSFTITQTDEYSFSPIETRPGAYVFSAPGYSDFHLGRDEISRYAIKQRRYTLSISIQLQSAAAVSVPYSDAPGVRTPFYWQGYSVVPDTGVFSIPVMRIYKEDQQVFEAYGEAVSAGPDGLLYWARYRGNTGSADFLTLDEHLKVNVIAHEALCRPMYVNTEFTTDAMLLKTGCSWRSTSGYGKLSRYDYGSRVIEELGSIGSDTSESIHEIPQGLLVVGTTGIFEYDGSTAYYDDRLFPHFEALLHNKSVLLTADNALCRPSTGNSSYKLRACPVGSYGSCSDIDPIIQEYNGWNNSGDIESLEYTILNDGSHLLMTTFLEDDDSGQPWYTCGYGEQALMVVPLDNEAQFGPPHIMTGDFSSLSNPITAPQGRWLCMQKRLDSGLHHMIYNLETMELRYQVPAFLVTLPCFPSTHDEWERKYPVFADPHTFLYMKKSSACFVENAEVCGDLMALDLDTGEHRVIRPRVRSFTLLDDGSLLVASACDEHDFCNFAGTEYQDRIALIEHIPSLSPPQQITGTPWLHLIGSCRFSSDEYSYCGMFNDPVTNGRSDPQMVHIDLRPGRALFTPNLSFGEPQAGSIDRNWQHRLDNHLYFTMNQHGYIPYSRMTYDFDDPGQVHMLGCDKWEYPPAGHTSGGIVTGWINEPTYNDFRVIPLSAPTSEYIFTGVLLHIDKEQDHLVYHTQVWDGGPEKEFFEVDISSLPDILDPKETCDE